MVKFRRNAAGLVEERKEARREGEEGEERANEREKKTERKRRIAREEQEKKNEPRESGATQPAKGEQNESRACRQNKQRKTQKAGGAKMKENQDNEGRREGTAKRENGGEERRKGRRLQEEEEGEEAETQKETNAETREDSVRKVLGYGGKHTRAFGLKAEGTVRMLHPKRQNSGGASGENGGGVVSYPLRGAQEYETRNEGKTIKITRRNGHQHSTEKRAWRRSAPGRLRKNAAPPARHCGNI